MANVHDAARREARQTNDDREMAKVVYKDTFWSVLPGLFMLLVLQLALFVGYLAGLGAPFSFVDFLVGLGAPLFVSESWRTVSICAAAACVGFGTCALLFQRRREREDQQLRLAYTTLRGRADALVAEIDRTDRADAGRSTPRQ